MGRCGWRKLRDARLCIAGDRHLDRFSHTVIDSECMLSIWIVSMSTLSSLFVFREGIFVCACEAEALT